MQTCNSYNGHRLLTDAPLPSQIQALPAVKIVISQLLPVITVNKTKEPRRLPERRQSSTHWYRWWRGAWWQCMGADSSERPAVRRNWRRWERWQPVLSDTWWGRRSTTTEIYRKKETKHNRDLVLLFFWLEFWGVENYNSSFHLKLQLEINHWFHTHYELLLQLNNLHGRNNKRPSLSVCLSFIVQALAFMALIQ